RASSLTSPPLALSSPLAPLPASPPLSLCPSRCSSCPSAHHPLPPTPAPLARLRACTCAARFALHPSRRLLLCSLLQADKKAEVIEFCCELVGNQEIFRTKRCKEDASLADRMHLCSEACQMAVSEACDKAFPTSQNSDYK
ncbi:unnamed protein product, partial [Closterium sp. NIES-53]